MSEESQPAELLRLGIAAAKAGRKEEAHETLLEVIKLDELNEQAWLWLSAVVDSNEERQICLENVLAINPANARAQAGLDWLRQSSAEPEGPPAEEQEEQEEQAEPEEPEGLEEPEELEQQDEPAAQDQQDEEPCPRCGAGIGAAHSTCPSCGLPLIVACPQCGEYAGVEDATCPHCGQALGDYRQGPAYHLGLASLYLQKHSTDRAQEALDRAEGEAAGDADVLAQVGALYEETGLRSRAIASYERAIEAAPRDPALYARLAGVYRRQGDRARATALYEKAEDLGSQDPAVTCELARLELEAGAAQQAVSRLQPLLRKQPVDPSAILLMGDALQKLGDSDAAVAHYRRVAQTASSDTDEGREARSKLAQMGAVPGRESGRSRSRSAPGERPGCVTLYALLTIAGALMGVLGAFALAALYARGSWAFQQALREQGMPPINLDQITPFLGVALIFALVSALVNLVIGVGLWLLKNWARLAVIVLSTLGFVASLVQVTLTAGTFRAMAGESGFSGLPLPVIAGMSVGFIVQAAIIFWFLVHRDVFD